MSEKKAKKKSNLTRNILIALVSAVILGLLLQSKAEILNEYIKPFGDIFLNLIKFIVTPIVFFSIIGGIVSMKDIKKVGEVGIFTIIYYFLTTSCAIVIRDSFKRIFPVIATTNLEFEVGEKVSFMDTLVNIFPKNFLSPMVEANMLQIIVGAMIVGFSILLIKKESQDKAIGAVEVLNDIFMKAMELILSLSPIGVFCLLVPVIAENGAMIIGSLASVLLVAYLAYALHGLVVYSFTIKTLAKISPIQFFKGMAPAIMFAFSSASSVGTIPINIKCCEELGADHDVTSFVLPLGATINMDGTAIYQGVCAVFIASCYGIDLTLGQMVNIVLYGTPRANGNSRSSRKRNDNACHGPSISRSSCRRNRPSSRNR